MTDVNQDRSPEVEPLVCDSFLAKEDMTATDDKAFPRFPVTQWRLKALIVFQGTDQR